MKYIVYCTTNTKSKINGINRIYVGVHKTHDPNIFDSYLGCGCKYNQPSTYKNPKSAFQAAVKKYGPNAFIRTTLFVFDDAKSAYMKEKEIVTVDFIKQSHVYNMVVGGEYEDRTKPLYQFDYKGNLIKEWESVDEASDFYGYPSTRWDGPKRNKCSFLDSYWSIDKTIILNEFSNKNEIINVYLYDKNGKLLKEFNKQSECAKFINYDAGELSRAIKYQNLIKKQYYVSNKLVDEFIPKPKNNYMNLTYYVYDIHNNFINKVIGKELMNLIDLHSWDYINHIFKHNNNWYKDFYISLEPINHIPAKRKGKSICVDVYTKFGEFIETVNSIKEVKEKYKIPASKIKNIQQGDRYFKNYIFKYNK